MRRSVLIVSVGLAATLGAATPAAAQSAPAILTTTLSGEEAVPPGDPDGSGHALVMVGPGGTVCFWIFTSDIGPITGVHIHEAPAGEVGGHAVDLFGHLIPLPGGDQIFVGCVRGSENAGDVAAVPSNFYVNVHTDEFPSGALRGQLGD